MTRKQIRVVGAVIVKDGLILCAQRGAAGNLAGLWEFPGGKVEPGETAEEALAREISEELACEVQVQEQITATTHSYEFGDVTLTTFYCALTNGVPSASEHAELAWIRPENLHELQWAPADVPSVHSIQERLA